MECTLGCQGTASLGCTSWPNPEEGSGAEGGKSFPTHEQYMHVLVRIGLLLSTRVRVPGIGMVHVGFYTGKTYGTCITKTCQVIHVGVAYMYMSLGSNGRGKHQHHGDAIWPASGRDRDSETSRAPILSREICF